MKLNGEWLLPPLRNDKGLLLDPDPPKNDASGLLLDP